MLAEIAGFAIDDDLIRHAAGLGALATVCGALAQGFRGEALAGVCDAEGAVDENLDGCICRGEFFDFPDGEFAGEDGALHGEEGFQKGQAFGGGDRHLGGCVELHVRGDLAGHFREAEILDDEGIDPGGGDGAELLLGGFQLAGENQGVHRDEAFDAVLVEIPHQLREVILAEIVGAEPCIKLGQAEVNRVRPGGDSCFRTVPVSCG